VSPGLVVYRYWLRRLQGILTQLRQAGTPAGLPTRSGGPETSPREA